MMSLHTTMNFEHPIIPVWLDLKKNPDRATEIWSVYSNSAPATD